MTDEELKALRRAASNTCSDAQKDFINALLDEREVDPKLGLSMEEIRKAVPHLSVGDATRWINKLRQLPKKRAQPTRERVPDVPAGRYAIRFRDNNVKFYRVDRPTEGRWAGWTFLSVQAGDELYPIKETSAKLAVLRIIAANPLEACSLYGREIGACGVCGRTLTNEESRRLGIGPVCRSRF
jgi:Family of unknown function (DUF6011)